MAKPRVLIIRDGAVGDLIQVTPGIRFWAEKGYRVDVACKQYTGNAVLANNPHYHQAVALEAQENMDARAKVIEKMKKKHPYKHVFDLAGVIEHRFLHPSFRPEYWAPEDVRRAYVGDANYFEAIAQVLGCPGYTKPELYLSPFEEDKFAQLRAHFLGKLLVQIQLDGSSINKAYPYWDEVAALLQKLDHRIIVMTTGGPDAVDLEAMVALSPKVDQRRLVCCAGRTDWTLRQSLLLTKFVHLFIGPETGATNASACWPTPKIVLLSHSNAANLCRDWENCCPIQSPANCSPCYRLVAKEDDCYRAITSEYWLQPALRCMAEITPESIIEKARIALCLS